MSMTGLAAKPGTDVDPLWSMRSATSPSAARMSPASSLNVAAHAGSYGLTSTRCARSVTLPPLLLGDLLLQRGEPLAEVRLGQRPDLRLELAVDGRVVRVDVGHVVD